MDELLEAFARGDRNTRRTLRDALLEQLLERKQVEQLKADLVQQLTEQEHSPFITRALVILMKRLTPAGEKAKFTFTQEDFENAFGTHEDERAFHSEINRDDNGNLENFVIELGTLEDMKRAHEDSVAASRKG